MGERFALVRLLSALVLVLLWFWFYTNQFPKLYYVFLLFPGLVFGIAVHKMGSRKAFTKGLLLKKNSLIELQKRIDLDFKSLPLLEPWEYPDFFQKHPIAIDLDLNQKHSLTALLDFTVTKDGFHLFCKRLLQESHEKPSELQERNSEIPNKKIALLYSLLFGAFQDQKKKIAFPLIEERSYEKIPFFYLYPFLGVFTPVWCVLAVFFDLPFVPLLLILNLVLWVPRRRLFQSVWKVSLPLVDVFERLGKCWKILKIGNSKELQESFKSLEKLTSASAWLLSPLPHLLLNLFFLWDFWKYKAWLDWHSRYGIKWNSWHKTWVPWEASLPFCLFSFCFPTTVYPTLKTDSNSISALGVFHPLIPDAFRVSNSLPNLVAGDIMVITGSNMSGKTTYMRSVAISFLLAGSGARVPALEWTIPNVRIFTMMRSQDSLENGISFFYSEVKRIAEIFREIDLEKKTCILFLDEILKGTNSTERTIATREILRLLQEKRAIVFLTTHDASITEMPEAKNYHFKENEVNGIMQFPYLLCQGPSVSTNALKIIAKEGIPIRIPEEK